MQLIKPSLISGEIMTLIEEADEKLILISPYYKIRKWYKLLKRLNAVKNKDIEITVYVRENERESMDEILEIGFQPIPIPNLHAKLYLNEKYAIVSSMNLLLSSDTNSIDIGFKTENEQEYDQIWDYYVRYIKSLVPKPLLPLVVDFDWREQFEKGLVETLGRKVKIFENANNITINTSNRYDAYIFNGEINFLKITGILSCKEYEHAKVYSESIQNTRLKIDLIKGEPGSYDTIAGTMNGLKSRTINELEKTESKDILEAMTKFIVGVEKLKKAIR
jgi:hypothetical protein